MPDVTVVEIERVAIRPAALGYDAGVIGAGLWARLQGETPDAGSQTPPGQPDSRAHG